VAVGAQTQSGADDKRELQALTDAVKAMQQELQEIKALLLQRGAPNAPTTAPPPATVPRGVVLDLGDHPSKGKADAGLTMVEFSDFQCPFCGRHFSQTEPLLMKEYVDTGKMKVVFIDFPLETIHPYALKAAETARCAAEQGKFWQMHDQLFRSQTSAAEFSNWNAHAQKVGLKMQEFQACLSAGKHASDIRKDLALGQSAGVSGTPGFFLAVTDPASNRVTPVRFISGAQPYAVFKAQIDALITN
jgi:protein-disulfide isomerase